MREFIRSQIENTLETFRLLAAVEEEHSTLLNAAEHTAQALKGGHKLLIAGNGGSAADAQHLAAEFVSRLTIDRPALPAIALTTDTSSLTAVSNDYGYVHVFRRQIEAIGRAGDVFMGISTSGKSPNILAALRECRARRISTIGLTGINSNDMKDMSDYLIVAPSQITQHIQECHLALEHIFCGLVERLYFGDGHFSDNRFSHQISRNQ